MTANVTTGPWSWCLAVRWVDVEGNEHITAVRGCQDPREARMAVAMHGEQEFYDFVGEPTPVAERTRA